MLARVLSGNQSDKDGGRRVRFDQPKSAGRSTKQDPRFYLVWREARTGTGPPLAVRPEANWHHTVSSEGMLLARAAWYTCSLQIR